MSHRHHPSQPALLVTLTDEGLPILYGTCGFAARAYLNDQRAMEEFTDAAEREVQLMRGFHVELISHEEFEAKLAAIIAPPEPPAGSPVATSGPHSLVTPSASAETSATIDGTASATVERGTPEGAPSVPQDEPPPPADPEAPANPEAAQPANETPPDA